jgi:hypothetical protein
MNAHTDDRQRSIAEHVRELSQETTGLVRDEVAAVRGELTDQARRMGAGAGFLGAAGALGLGAFGAATAMLVAVLGRGRAARGGLLVAILYGAAGTALAAAGRERIRAAGRDVADAVQEGADAASGI